MENRDPSNPRNDPMNTMTAYHGDETIKYKYLDRIRKHRTSGQLLQRSVRHWDGLKGSALGCTIHDCNYDAYKTELGIPREIADLEQGLFGSLPAELAQTWPERFMEAITPGQDLSLIAERFLTWLLVDPAEGLVRFSKRDKAREAIQRVADSCQKKLSGGMVSWNEWKHDLSFGIIAVASNNDDYAAACAAPNIFVRAIVIAAINDAIDDDSDTSSRINSIVRQSEKLLELIQESPTIETPNTRYEKLKDGQHWWCDVHHRPATHKLVGEGYWDICCDPNLDGITFPCVVRLIKDQP